MSTSPRNLVFIASLLLIIGAFLPWATLTSPFLGVSIPLTGIEGDGIFTALGGGILLFIAISAKPTPGKNYSVLGIIISILCFILLFGKFGAIGDVSNEGAIATIGIGLYASIIGSILGVAGSLMKTSEDVALPKESNPAENQNVSSTPDVSASTEIPTQPKK